MKYLYLFLIVLFSDSLMGQESSVDVVFRNEISTDLSGAFTGEYRLDYNRLFKDKMAFVAGLRTRSQNPGVVVDTAEGTNFLDQVEFVDNGIRLVDASFGFRWYFGEKQPRRGLWLQSTALVSVLDWRTEDFEDARMKSIYPEEYIEPLTMVGIEANIGYRYLFSNGISLNAYLAFRGMIDRRRNVTDRFTENQRTTGGFDFLLSGSFLTLGYVW